MVLKFTQRSFEQKINNTEAEKEYKEILNSLENLQKETKDQPQAEDTHPSQNYTKTSSNMLGFESDSPEIIEVEKENLSDVEQYLVQSPRGDFEDLTKDEEEEEEKKEDIDELPLEFYLDDQVQIPQDILQRLMKHQPKGIKFFWENINLGRGCILADFMGLGKSLQTLIFLYLYKKKNPKENILILCPLNVAKHWENECKKLNEWVEEKEDHLFALNLSSQKTITSRRNFLKKWKEKSSILIITYELFKTLIIEQEFFDDLVDPGPSIAILDEGHRIRNFDTNITKNIVKLKTQKRIILTGYPFQNNLLEYFTMINFVSPGILGEMRDFKRIFEKPISEGKYFNSPLIKKQLARKRAWLLHSRVKDIILRRDSSYLVPLLPQKFEVTITVELSSFQREIYTNLINGLRNYSSGRLVFWSFDLITMLCNHPDILHTYTKNLDFTKDEEYNLKFDVYNSVLTKLYSKDYEMFNESLSNKFAIAMSIILNSKKVGDKVVLFSRSIQTLNYFEKIIKNYNLNNEELNYVRFDGSTGQEMREDLIDSFNTSSKINLFLISTLAGGEGINLYSGNRIILFDVNWNPCHDAEACCRVYRYGQKKQVWIYRLISHQTMEEIVYKRQLKKEVVSRWVIDDQSSSLQSDSNQNELFVVPEEKKDEKPEELIQEIVLKQNDSVTNDTYQQHESKIYSLVLHNELLREDVELTLTDEEMKRAHAEEEWDIVYGKRRSSNVNKESNPQKRKKKERKYLFKEGVISSEEESSLDEESEEEDEDSIEETIEKPSPKKINLSVNTTLGLRKPEQVKTDVSPKSASSNSGNEVSPHFHKKLEEEKKKLFTVQQKNNDFRKLVRDQLNDFKSKVSEFYSKN